MRFSIFQDTALGARSVNQDRMGYCFTRDCLLMLLADGMGGHLRGEVAAQIAIQSAAATFQDSARPLVPDPVAFLDHALRSAHREILRYQEVHALPESPRTTVVACIVQRGRAWWAHAGDSRLYFVRAGALAARTRDHSKVESLVALGLLRAGEQEQHPERNKVLNCLGSPFEPTIEISRGVDLVEGDTILLCSDGLWSGIPEEMLCARLALGKVAEVVPALVRDAVLSTGRMADNTTAVAMNWEGDEGVIDTLISPVLQGGAVTTTIGFAQIEPDANADISDEEIERTIDEIREAIERSATR
ncbi:MAG: serine/threonine-protein phosphatase [Burkholderiaceae bacterium]|nr:serine/threonine-protein phosphatase [Burkholderiaceae bacterium]